MIVKKLHGRKLPRGSVIDVHHHCLVQTVAASFPVPLHIPFASLQMLFSLYEKQLGTFLPSAFKYPSGFILSNIMNTRFQQYRY